MQKQSSFYEKKKTTNPQKKHPQQNWISPFVRQNYFEDSCESKDTTGAVKLFILVNWNLLLLELLYEISKKKK